MAQQLGASVGLAHARLISGIYYDSNDQKLHIEGMEHVGLEVGEKLRVHAKILALFVNI